MWYVIQIIAGKEKEMQKLIEKRIDCACYENCFFIKREQVWRRDGKCIIHVEPMFPGYLFVSTNVPGKLFKFLKDIPQFLKLLKTPENFYLHIEKEEQIFLENMVNGDAEYVVRLSEVKLDQEKNIVQISGPLEKYQDRIVKKKVRLRYVIIRVELLGKTRDVLVGIKL